MKAKWSKLAPADYHDEHQCDSDDVPEYICDETVSPKENQDKGCDTYKQRQKDKNKKSTGTPKRTKGGQTSPATPATPLSPASETSDAGKRTLLNIQSRVLTIQRAQRNLQRNRARKANLFEEVGRVEESLQANRDRITATSQDEEDDEITRSDNMEKMIVCNYCGKKWNGFELPKTALQNFVVRQQEQEQSQNEIIPGTQGQELENISGNIVRNNSKSIFAFKDDEIHDEPGRQMDAVVCELINYNNVKLYAKVKEKILAKNVNKAILVKANVQHISPNTTFLSPQAPSNIKPFCAVLLH